MNNNVRKIVLGLTLNALCVGLLALCAGCKPVTPTKTWQGDEQVFVTLGIKTATVSLHGMIISTYNGVEGIKLSAIVQKADLATSAALEEKYFNFIAVDGYDMSLKAIYWQKSLPDWEDMQQGYLYDSGTSGGLTAMWEDGTKEYAFNGGRFYNVRLMDGGTIQIRDVDVL